MSVAFQAHSDSAIIPPGRHSDYNPPTLKQERPTVPPPAYELIPKPPSMFGKRPRGGSFQDDSRSLSRRRTDDPLRGGSPPVLVPQALSDDLDLDADELELMVTTCEDVESDGVPQEDDRLIVTRVDTTNPPSQPREAPPWMVLELEKQKKAVVLLEQQKEEARQREAKSKLAAVALDLRVANLDRELNERRLALAQEKEKREQAESRLELEKKQWENESEDFKNKLRVECEKVQVVGEALVSADRELERTREELAATKKKYETPRGKNRMMQLDAAKTRAEKAEFDLAATMQKLQERETELGIERGKVSMAYERAEVVEVKFDAARAEVRGAKENEKANRARLQQLQKEIDKLKERETSLIAISDSQTSRAAKAEGERDQKRIIEEKLHRQIRDIGVAATAISEELASLMTQYQTVSRNLATALSELADSKHKLQVSEESVNSVQSDLASSQSALNTTQSSLNTTRHDLENALREIELKRRELEAKNASEETMGSTVLRLTAKLMGISYRLHQEATVPQET